MSFEVESEKFYQSLFYQEQVIPIQEKIIQSQVRFEQLKSEYQSAGREKLNQVKAEMQLAQIEFHANMKKMKVLVRAAQMQTQMARY